MSEKIIKESSKDINSKFSVKKVVIAIVAIVLVVLLISFITFKLQGNPIKSAEDALSYLESNSYWNYFKPEVSATRETDAPLKIGNKLYYVSYFIDDENTPVTTYTYYVDEKANVYTMDNDFKMIKQDKYEQNIIPQYREDYKIKHVFDANDLLYDGGYVDPSKMVDEIKIGSSSIISGKQYYNLAVIYSDKVEKFVVDFDGNVFILEDDGSLTEAKKVI